MTADTDADIPFFDVPLNLPHAGTVALRIRRLIENQIPTGTAEGYEALVGWVVELEDLLRPYRLTGDEPGAEESERVRQEAAALGRQIVEGLTALHWKEDRLGQCIRNLFECLEMGREGAILSLTAGENPRSLQRPV